MALRPSISFLTVSDTVASPQMSRCRPSVQTSPGKTKAACSRAAVKSKSSSATSPPGSAKSFSISSASKPVISRSKPSSLRSANSRAKSSSSHPALSASLLSARIYARFCASVRCSTNTQGISVKPSSRAAIMRPCPAIMFNSLSTMIGLTKPNSRREERSCKICSLLWVRAFLAYGTRRSIFTFSNRSVDFIY